MRGEEQPVPKHDDSETETEGEDDLTCQADRVSYTANGKTIPLSDQPCRDVAASDLVRLMDTDATRSNQEELVQEDGAFYFHGCNHHRAVYENSIHKRRCAVDGCYSEAKLNKEGLRLCKLHSTREERPKAPARRVKAKSGPKGPMMPSSASVPALEVEDDPVTAARIAPGHGDSGDQRHEGEGAALLGTYLRAILQGVSEREAIGLTSTPACGVQETKALLREAALNYLPRLPDDYPTKAREAVVHLVLNSYPQEAKAPAKDPVLELDYRGPEEV